MLLNSRATVNILNVIGELTLLPDSHWSAALVPLCGQPGTDFQLVTLRQHQPAACGARAIGKAREFASFRFQPDAPFVTHIEPRLLRLPSLI